MLIFWIILFCLNLFFAIKNDEKHYVCLSSACVGICVCRILDILM